MRLAVLSVSLALGFAVGYSAQKEARVESRRLFVLERSTNLNVVAYDARLRGGAFDPERPIDAYWILFEKDGAREELNHLERQKAYGVRILQASAREVVFALAALPSRPVTVRLEGGDPVPVVEILGEPARLAEVFVAARDGLVPGVRYVELRGRSERNGRELVERIAP